ncbi:phosphate ABC transporter permease subunit PstC [Halorussus sp. AFM4]|uniref:phosphate ABC transporter permease subunit PstC n=1 Tax=Halorussus sp. AFM4 TaxID=3421651 RepID=UPI003EB78B1B
MSGESSRGTEQSFQRSGVAVRKERVYKYILLSCAALTVFVTFGIIGALIGDTLVFFQRVSILDYLTGTHWEPAIKPYRFGVLPLVSGTLIITIGSALVSLPIGLAAAIYLSEYASDRVRSVIKPALEVLAGVPTVVYGYFALVYITPALRTFFPLGTFNAMSASVVVGIMIIPMVSSISEDAISSVPDSLREAAYGLGSTKFDVSTKVVVPAAFSGVISSYVLALSRAIGETMAVTIAAGQSPQMPYFPDVMKNFYESTETITAAMVNIGLSDITGSTPAFYAMFALGLTLFVMTFSMNLIAEYIRNRYREVYR